MQTDRLPPTHNRADIIGRSSAASVLWKITNHQCAFGVDSTCLPRIGVSAIEKQFLEARSAEVLMGPICSFEAQERRMFKSCDLNASDTAAWTDNVFDNGPYVYVVLSCGSVNGTNNSSAFHAR